MSCSRGWRKPIIALCAFVLVSNASGADLRKFAEEATGNSSAPAEKKKEPQYSPDAATSSFGSGTYPSGDGGASFMGGFFAWLIASPFEYRNEDPAASIGGDTPIQAEGRAHLFPEHFTGEATVPYARLDYNRQSIDSDTDGNDFRVELGYKLLAFHARSTLYSNKTLGQDLDINQYYGVLRYGGYRSDFLPGTFEAAIGLGISEIKLEDSIGSIDESGTALTLPLKYYPVQWFGVEFRPAWYTWIEGSTVGDYDLSASFGHRYLQVRGGYRWLTAGGEMLDGPYAGVSLSF